jgi:hypothetical protein
VTEEQKEDRDIKEEEQDRQQRRSQLTKQILEVINEIGDSKVDHKKNYLLINSIDTSAVKFVVVVGFMLRDIGKIPRNFPWDNRPKRGWFHSICILGWKVLELWFHGTLDVQQC